MCPWLNRLLGKVALIRYNAATIIVKVNDPDQVGFAADSSPGPSSRHELSLQWPLKRKKGSSYRSGIQATERREIHTPENRAQPVSNATTGCASRTTHKLDQSSTLVGMVKPVSKQISAACSKSPNRSS